MRQSQQSVCYYQLMDLLLLDLLLNLLLIVFCNLKSMVVMQEIKSFSITAEHLAVHIFASWSQQKL